MTKYAVTKEILNGKLHFLCSVRWRAFQNHLTALLIIVTKLSIVDVCGGSDYHSENSATWTKCNRKNLQYAKSVIGKECKAKTLKRVKVQHEMVQYMKRVCNMKMMLYEKSATWKSINCHSEIRKKCTRVVNCS